MPGRYNDGRDLPPSMSDYVDVTEHLLRTAGDRLSVAACDELAAGVGAGDYRAAKSPPAGWPSPKPRRFGVTPAQRGALGSSATATTQLPHQKARLATVAALPS